MKNQKNLSYCEIINIIEILELNSKIFSNYGNRRYINIETIIDEKKLLQLCNDAISYTTTIESNYKRFEEIDLEKLKDAFTKVLDYKIAIGGIKSEYNIIKSIEIYPGELNKNYLVFEFNKEYNSALLNESEKLKQFCNEINKELISGTDKTVEQSIILLLQKYKLRKNYRTTKIQLDDILYQVEILLENKIKIGYLGFYDKNIESFKIIEILINNINIPLI